MKLQYQARYVSAVPLARGSRKPNGRAVLWRSGSPEESIRQGLGDQDNHPIPTSPAASGVKAVTERADAARTGDSTQDTYTPAQPKPTRHRLARIERRRIRAHHHGTVPTGLSKVRIRPG